MCTWTLWRRIGPILLTNACSRHCSFWRISLICSVYFSEVTVFLGVVEKALLDQMATNHWTVTMTFFWCKFGLRSTLELLGPTSKLVVPGCHIQSTFLPITIQLRNDSLLLHRIKENDTIKQHFFDFWSAQEAPTYQAFSHFHLASNAKRP